MSFSLDNYVDVPTRLTMAFAKYPDLRIQESKPQIVEVDGQRYVEISCTVWRDANDPIPTVAYCWEPIPGKTPYTRGSEMMNASTSCLGRSLGFQGFGVTKAIASRDEVKAAQSRAPTGQLATVTPITDIEMPFPDDPPREYASPKQLGMIRALCNGLGAKNSDEIKAMVGKALDRPIGSMSDITKRDASVIIDYLKQPQPEQPY